MLSLVDPSSLVGQAVIAAMPAPKSTTKSETESDQCAEADPAAIHRLRSSWAKLSSHRMAHR